MNILLITDEVWNDEVHGNNVLTNWFEGFPANFSNIYCSPGVPKNNVCMNYFQLTDKMMARSLLGSKRAGEKITVIKKKDNLIIKNVCNEDKKLYDLLKKVTGDFLRMIRQLIWVFGKYDMESLDKFLEEQKPDIIFAARYSSLKLLRIEKYVKSYLDIPIVAYTGDDEYSLSQIKISPFYWIYKLILRYKMRKQIPDYSLYYTHSIIQAQIYHQEFSIKTKTLLKTGDFKEKNIHDIVNDVIKIVYIGKLYCNRWKTLGIIAKTLEKINKDGTRAILEIYTLDKITNYQKKLLNDRKNSFIMGGIKPDEIPNVYKNSDIVLHVESFDLKNKLLTKYSFSTKVIDSLASGCALWTIGWEKHCACKYLKENNCALVSTSKTEIESTLLHLVDNKKIILEYAKKAYIFGSKYLQKKFIQEQIKNDFEKIIKNSKSSKFVNKSQKQEK